MLGEEVDCKKVIELLPDAQPGPSTGDPTADPQAPTIFCAAVWMQKLTEPVASSSKYIAFPFFT